MGTCPRRLRSSRLGTPPCRGRIGVLSGGYMEWRTTSSPIATAPSLSLRVAAGDVVNGGHTRAMCGKERTGLKRTSRRYGCVTIRAYHERRSSRNPTRYRSAWHPSESAGYHAPRRPRHTREGPDPATLITRLGEALNRLRLRINPRRQRRVSAVLAGLCRTGAELNALRLVNRPCQSSTIAP